MYKKLFILMSILLILSGCSPTEKIPPITREQKMTARSLVSEGNTYRLNEKAEAAKNGEETIIAYIGGSVTEGFLVQKSECYAKLSFDRIKKLFGNGDNIRYLNAGLGGTASTLGNIRLQRDVLSKNADIIFVEFALNDKSEQIYREATECLIRTCLNDKNKPAVILLITCDKAGHSVQDQLEQIGRYYNLPVISAGNALKPEWAAGRLKPTDFVQDWVHPTKEGHKLLADFILHLFEKTEDNDSNVEYIVPKPMFPNALCDNIKFIDVSDIQSDNDGSFVRTTCPVGGFPNCIKFISETGNNPFVFTLEANNLYFVYPSYEENKGYAEIFVNGEKVCDINENSKSEWQRPVSSIVFTSDKVKKAVVEIKVPQDKEDSGEGEFILSGIGYTQNNAMPDRE